MQLEVFDVLPRQLLEESWKLYDKAFADLRIRAAQRHLMTPEEFHVTMQDPRIGKHVVTDPNAGGRICGMSAIATDVAAVPLLSPEYFAHHWPDLYSSGRIWYTVFVAVHPDYHGIGVLGHLIGSMVKLVAPTGGLVGADISTWNQENLRLSEAIGQLANTFAPGWTVREIDAQHYVAYEFPSPAA